MFNRYRCFSSIPFFIFATLLTALLPHPFSSTLSAQPCACTNCPQFMQDNFVGNFDISVQGAANPTLGQNGQGVCGVTMSFDHEYLGDLSITLTSPSGQSVQLVGPIGFFGPTLGTTWNVTFLPCGDPAVAPDPGFNAMWSNNQPWNMGPGTVYSGSYYPNSGCLQSFSGPVNGTWTLTVVDGQAVDVGNFYNYEIIFCDPSGINCFSCAADAGELPQPNVAACEGSASLNLNLPPAYNPPTSIAPPATDYSYTYVVSGAGGVIQGYEPGADLSSYPVGVYNVCGLSYLSAQENSIPAPNGALTTNQLNTQLTSGQPPFCGDLTTNCVQVTVNASPPDIEDFETICAPDCFLYYGQNFCQTGTHVRNLNQNGCPYTATLYLTVVTVPPTNLIEVICAGECSQIPGFETACTQGLHGEMFENYLGCDSLVTLNLTVLSAVANIVAPPELACNQSSLALQGTGSSTGGGLTYMWTASNGGTIVGPTNSINTSVSTAGDYQLKVCKIGGGISCCDSASVTVIQNQNPPTAPAAINGNNQVCEGQTLNLSATPVGGNGTYTWTVPPGVTINAGQGTTVVNLAWNTPASGDVCVTYSNACGESPPTCVSITANAPAIPTLPTGPILVCAGTSENYETTINPNATNYLWTVTAPATISAGQGTNAVVINWGNAAAGSVCVRETSACGTSQPVCLPVQINAPPASPTVTGSTIGCSSGVGNYTIAPINGATSYDWQVTGGTITGGNGATTVQVTWNANAISGSVCASAVNACGSSAANCLDVTLGAPPPQPDITGNNAICAGTTGTYSITPISGVSGYTWTVPPGATIVTGQNTSSLNVFWTATPGGNICVSATSACGSGPQDCFPVVVTPQPVANAGAGGTVCGTSFNLQATPSVAGSSGVWTTVPGAGTATFANANSAATVVTINQNGTYIFVWQEQSGTCTSSDSLTVVFNASPTAGQINHDCDGSNQNYTVSFPITGGTAPYTVAGGSVTGGVFTSNPVPSGQPYSFQVTDANGCTSSTLTGNFNCACATDAGMMSLLPLAACQGASIAAVHNGGQTLDANDIAAYVLHTNSGTTLGTVFGQNTTGIFNFQSGMAYETTYYVSFVVGNNLNGAPDPNDPCLSVAQGQPVVWHQNPVANAGADADTCGLTLPLNGNVGTGTGTWTVGSSPAGATLALDNPQSATTTATASAPGAYSLTWTIDNLGCTATDNVQLTFHTAPGAGQISHVCDGTNQNYTVSFPITGGAAPYTVPGGSVTNGVFTSNPVSNGQVYFFQVTDANGCVSATLTGNFNCSCATNAGMMSLEPLDACAGSSITAQHLGGQNLDANDVGAYVLHTNSGPTLGTAFGQNATGVFTFQSGMAYETTYYVSFVVGNTLNGMPDPNDPCFSVTQGQPVVWHQNPVANAGPDTDTCGLTISLNANAGTGAGTWTVVGNPAGLTLTLGDPQNPATTASASYFGTYSVAWTIDNLGCTDADTVQLTFSGLPTTGPVATNCDATNQNYTVTFPLNGGTGPYTVNGMPVAGLTFISAPIASGTTYSFTLNNASGCSAPTVTGSFLCNCSTQAGTMEIQTLSTCEGGSVTAIHLGGEALDGDDVTAYVLHTGNGNSLGTVLDQNPTGVFNFQTGLAYGATYFISFVVGNNLNGQPDPNDPCLAVAPGQPVTFFQNPVANAGQDADTCGLSLSLSGTSGPGQWTVSSAPNGATLIFADEQDAQSVVTASANGAYSLSWTAMANGCVSVDQVALQFHVSPSLADVLRTCDAANENFIVTLTLTGGATPYTVNGNPVAGSSYSSLPLPNGQSYAFSISDANGCSAPDVNGAYSCNCATNAGTMAAPALSACAGQTIPVTANNDHLLDGNDVTAYVLHDGAGPALGNVLDQNTTGVFAFQAGMIFGKTYYVSLVAGNPLNGQPNPSDPCFSVAAGQAVLWLQHPAPDAGTDNAVCASIANLQAASSSFSGNWSQVSGPGTTVFSAATNNVSDASASLSGSYIYRWTEVNGTCTGADEVTVDFNELPAVNALDETCDGTNTQFTVTFSVVGGTAPYSVNGLTGAFTANNFTSNGMPNNAGYDFQVTDANGCTSGNISGAKNCNCGTDAGSIVTTPATFCADQPATSVWNNDATLDANDLLQFILHSASGTTVGTVYATAAQPSFQFGGNLQPGVVYYISAVAGNNLNSAVDLTDDCLSVAPGAPVQWKLLPTAALTGDASICSGSSTALSFSGTGSFPLEVTYTGPNGFSGSLGLTGPQTVNLDVSPSSTATYTLTGVVDGTLPACSVLLNDQVTVQLNPTVEAGTAASPLEFCAGVHQTVPLAQQLNLADAGGSWTEVSVTPSMGAAFSAAAASFNTAGQIAGTYIFRYYLDATTPCPDDEALVTVTIHPTPVADAGADKMLDCQTASVVLGGPSTSTGAGLLYVWTLDTAVVSTNLTWTTTTEGLYALLITNTAGCSDQDQVLVTMDSRLPAGRLLVQGVRCFGNKNGSIRVDSVVTAHPPVLFSLNGGPFVTSPVFAPLLPGAYTLTLQDAKGCEWTSDLLTVTEPPELIVNLGPDIDLSLGDMATVQLQTSIPLSALDTIIWNPLLDSTASGQPFQHWFPTGSQQIGVQVVDSSGCLANDRVLLLVNRLRHIYIPNIIAPSASGNDVITVFGGRDVEEVEQFQIFDRWGEALYTLFNFQPNNVADGWSGKYRGQEVTPGVYAYYAVVRFKDGEKEVFSGDVTVVR